MPVQGENGMHEWQEAPSIARQGVALHGRFEGLDFVVIARQRIEDGIWIFSTFDDGGATWKRPPTAALTAARAYLNLSRDGYRRS